MNELEARVRAVEIEQARGIVFHEQNKALLEDIRGKLAAVLASVAAGDVDRASIKASVESMAPAVKTLQDYLVLGRFGKWFLGIGGVTGIAWLTGVLDNFWMMVWKK